MTSAPVAAGAPGLEQCFLFEAVEASYEVTGIEGAVPAWLRGSYYVNGPALFERAGLRYKHWLDGDGMICSLRFTGDGVRFTNRFVETQKRREEEEAGRFIYRGFGTAFPGDKLRRGLMLEPPVNVSVYPFDGRLLAFGEQTLPYDLDPITLETRGEYDFHGKLNAVSPFAAHAKLDPNLMNFGVQFSPNQPILNVYEFDPSGALVRRKRHPLTMPHSIHDFGFTPSSYVFFLSPLLMDFERFHRDAVSVVESLQWEPERGSSILVLPRSSDASAPAVFSAPAGHGYCLHLINSFDRADGKLVVDILELDEPVYPEYQPIPDVFSTVKGCRPVRFIVDRASQRVEERIAMDYEHTPDFPSIHPQLAGREYNDFWMLGISAAGGPGRKFFDELAHGSWRAGGVRDVYRAAPGHYLGGEPVFVPNPSPDAGESDGVIVVQHLLPESQAAEFLLFDAAHVARGPIARLPLRHPIHPGFHASFQSEVN